MRKRMIGRPEEQRSRPEEAWLDIERLAEVEISSEHAAHPIESALLPGRSGGWRAAEPGKQTIRLLFTPPQDLHRIRLEFLESSTRRTQEYVLRWSHDGGQSFREIVRQQWNFSPDGATCETEDYRVALPGLTVLELVVSPDVAGNAAFASLAQLQVA
jgi:hypothetical protein